MIQLLIHYSLHFLFPGLIAYLFFRSKWKKAWLIMIATMVIDADHLLADPIFLANRCSLGFHFLHSYPAIFIYVLLLLPKQTRIIATGLLLHMATDGLDCVLMN